MTGAVKVRSEEAVLYNYWLVVLKLLEAKIPYEFIVAASEAEITMIMAVDSAIIERKNQVMARA